MAQQGSLGLGGAQPPSVAPEDLKFKDPVSLDDLQRLIPGDRASAAAAAPSTSVTPTSAVSQLGKPGSVTPEDIRRFQLSDAAKKKAAVEHGDSGIFTAEGARTFGPLAAATGVALAVPPAAPLATRMALQGAAGLGSEFAIRMLQGEDPEDAIGPALATGASFAAAEGVATKVIDIVAKTYVGARGIVHSVNAGLRTIRGKPPLPDIPRLRSTSAPNRQDLKGGVQEGQEVYDTIVGLGGVPQIANLVDNSFVTTVQNILEKAFTSMGRQANIAKMNERLLKTGIQDVVDQMPQLGRRDMRKLLQGIVTGRLDRIKGISGGFISAGDKIAGTKMILVPREIIEEVPRLGVGGKPILDSRGVPIVEQVTRTVNDLVPEFGADIGIAQELAKSQLKRLESGNRGNPGLEKQLKIFINKPRIQTIAATAQMRSELFSQSKQFTVGNNAILDQDKAFAKALTGPLTQSMNKAMDAAPPEAKLLYNKGRQLWKEEVRGDLTSAYIAKLANTQSDTFLESMMFSRDPQHTTMLRNIVMKENPEAWEAVQGSFMQHLLWKNSKMSAVGENLVAKDLNAQGVLNDLGRIASEDQAGLTALFPNRYDKAGTVFAGFKRYINALASQQKRGGGGSGGMFVELQQASAVKSAVQAGGATGVLSLGFGASAKAASAGAVGVAAVTAAAFLLLPKAAGRLWTNQAFVQWMTVGARNAPGTVPAMKAGIATIGILLKEELFNTPEEAEAAANYAADLSRKLSEAGVKP